MTRYAEKILGIINASTDHMTAEQIFLKIKGEEPKIVLASVYNNLNALVKAGRIRVVALDGETDRYDKIDKHDHLICARCGKLADFEFADLTPLLSQQLCSGVFKYDLKVFYECPECRNKKN